MAPGKKPVVLLVEDEFLIRLATAQWLEDDGFEVFEADDAQSALDVLESHPDVDLLFTDINMPGRLNGLDLARQVCREHPAIHLILTSGRVALPLEDIPDDGAFVTKPYSLRSVSGLMKAMVAA